MDSNELLALLTLAAVAPYLAEAAVRRLMNGAQRTPTHRPGATAGRAA